MKNICVITGSRAEYGLLSRLMKLIKHDSVLNLQIVATNMHLSPEFGLTYREIIKDGFSIDKKVEMLLSSDTSNATVKSVGLAMIGFADAYEDLKPDLLIVLGDRFEILAAVSAALFYKIPVAHIHGGEITEGAYDDSIRHAITKMSHLHFTSTKEYRKRVIQLGEEPERVFNVGALGIDNIQFMDLLPKEELEKNLSFHLTEKSVFVTYHPVTLENATAEEQIDNLLVALDCLKGYKIIFSMPNSDTGGRIIKDKINKFVNDHKNEALVFASLGQLVYFSLLKYVNLVIGNSSSGILEVPSFGIPTLNIGDRQKGRIAAESVINVGNTVEEIKEGLKRALSPEIKKISENSNNPYYKKNTAEEIIQSIKSFESSNIIKKKFYDLQ